MRLSEPTTKTWMSVVSFLEWLFRVKFCFRAGLADYDRATSKNNCVKTNKDRHILSAAQIFFRDFSFWQYKVCGYSQGRFYVGAGRALPPIFSTLLMIDFKCRPIWSSYFSGFGERRKWTRSWRGWWGQCPQNLWARTAPEYSLGFSRKKTV